MLEIIAMLEAAKNAHPRYDDAIFEFVHGRKRRQSTFEQYDPSEPRIHYSSSIDVALTLVPEGWCWGLFDEPNAWLWPDAQRNLLTGIQAKGATPAIALCIAALKARAATQASSNSNTPETKDNP